jgi:Trp operon repressor
MEHLSSEMEQQNQVQWRREKVQELCSKGYSQREISQILQVGLATVNRDMLYFITCRILIRNYLPIKCNLIKINK